MTYKVHSTTSILLILALGGVLQGLETTSMSIFVSSEHFTAYFKNPGSLAQGIIAGSNPIGAFIGCWICGSLSDRFGRVVTMQVASGIWVIGSAVSIFVMNLPMVIIGRAIKGLTVGIFSSILPVYVGDVVPDTKKGKATSIMQFCLTFGIMIMFYLSILCDMINDDRSFRLAWGLEAIPGALLVIFAFLLPESPKWLAAKGRWTQASEVQDKINRANSVVNSDSTARLALKKGSDSGNLEKIEGVLDRYEKEAKTCTHADLFRRDLRPHLLTGILTQCLTQLSGIGVLMYYLIFICEMIGLSGDAKLYSASVQYVLNVLFTFIPILLMNRMRRKDVIVYGALSLGTCIGAIGVIMGHYGHSISPVDGNISVVWEVNGNPGNICLALCYLFVAIFATSLSCAGWLYTNEIFPNRAKSKGSAICMSVSWSMSFILTFLAPISLAYLKWGTFLVFSAFCFIGATIVGFFCPETLRLKQHEINSLFANPTHLPNNIERKPLNSNNSNQVRNPVTIRDLEEQQEELLNKAESRESHTQSAILTFPIMKELPSQREDFRKAVSLRVANPISVDQPSSFLRKVGSPLGKSKLAKAEEEKPTLNLSSSHYCNLDLKESHLFNNHSQESSTFD